MTSTRIGFVGAGNMASALVSGLVRAGAAKKEDIVVSDPDAARREQLGRDHGVETRADNAELVKATGVVVLSVKPQVIPRVLAECAPAVTPDHLVISIVAGVPLRVLEEGLGRTRVVRAMPNTPALAGAAATAVSAGSGASAEDLAIARKLFDAVGRTVVLEEKHLDAVTGLSGSGPGYVMLFVEALADGGVKCGLPRDVALLLAAQTVLGSAKLLLETGEHPGKLKDMVTSPGGTTIAGLAALEARAFRGAVIEAVERATLRSAELGKKT